MGSMVIAYLSSTIPIGLYDIKYSLKVVTEYEYPLKLFNIDWWIIQWSILNWKWHKKELARSQNGTTKSTLCQPGLFEQTSW